MSGAVAYFDAEAKINSLINGERIQGHLKSYSPGNGYGFIVSQICKELFQSDVYVNRNQVDECGAGVGAAVSFTIFLTKDGKPQARNLAVDAPGSGNVTPGPTPRMKDPESVPPNPSSGERRCFGHIKSLGETAGFGFITCPEVKEAYGADVFLHKIHFGAFKVGDPVVFTLEFEPEKGRPRARDVEAAPPGASSADPTGQGYGAWGHHPPPAHHYPPPMGYPGMPPPGGMWPGYPPMPGAPPPGYPGAAMPGMPMFNPYGYQMDPAAWAAWAEAAQAAGGAATTGKKKKRRKGKSIDSDSDSSSSEKEEEKEKPKKRRKRKTPAPELEPIEDDDF
eukprot:TRINITY_DN112636_c0_g1_i1.p1 TRINITY_DN112636_c0_g1~~TRINITY_DN112636_c0_g1_i1.p1  ORF type:complete len:336 (-),score=84.04 TRINITY_DN112636_c0_g1_i1:93-1100(-)